MNVARPSRALPASHPSSSLPRAPPSGLRRVTIAAVGPHIPEEAERGALLETKDTLAERRGRPGEALQPLPVADERGLLQIEPSSDADPVAMGGRGAAGTLDWLRPEVYSAYLRPELVAIALVYLVQGLLGLSRLAVFVFLKDELGLAPATVALVTSSGYGPWMIKPVYGFLSDAVPLFGYKRCSYLAICGLLGATAWTSMAVFANSPTAVVALLLLGSASTACADVVADSVVVELVRRPGSTLSTAGSLQSLCWASASAGGIASAYFSGSLVNDHGPRFVFGLTALFPLLVTAAAIAIPEQRIVKPPVGVMSRNGSGGAPGGLAGKLGGRSRSGSPGLRLPTGAWHLDTSQQRPKPEPGIVTAVKQQVVLLWGTVKQRSIFLPAVFVFVWQATPTADTAMLFFETNQLGFSAEVLGRIRLVGALASLAGVGLFNFKLKTLPLRRILFWSAIVGALLGLTQLMLVTGVNRQLGLSDQLFALADTALLTVLGQVAFMPLLVLAARICPEGVEATLFALLMSVLNSGSFVGNALGSGLTAWLGVTSDNYDNLALLITLCTLSSLLPLPLLRLLPDDVDQDDAAEGGGGGKGEALAGEDSEAGLRKES